MMRTALFLGLVLAAAGRADDAPSWLHAAARLEIPALDPKAPAVVLLQETHVAVEDDGRTVTTTRKAVRIISPEGRPEARGTQAYIAGASKVRDIRAWVIAPSGRSMKVGPQAIYDRANYNDLYNEVRERGIQGNGSVDPGSVFGYEAITEERSVFSQFEWHFQDRLPTLASRYTLALPKGWHAESVTYNGAGLSPSVHDTTYTWEARNLPYIETEPLSPSWLSLVPRVAVSYFPPSGVSPGLVRTFASWKEVSRWLTDLSDPKAEPTPEVTAKAEALTSNAKTEAAKIRQIVRFVQGIKYTSIQTGIGRGGGYRPHAAADILLKQYGDCKDKATLLRAMLKAVGIGSYMVSIYSGDRSYVQEDFPSPQQFNHAIVAIKVSPEERAYAVVEHPVLGRLMLCDPTSGFQPGLLPLDEQGSFALVDAGDNGALLRLPMSPPVSSTGETRVEAVLAENGNLSATTFNGRAWQHEYPRAGELKNNRLLVFKPPTVIARAIPYLTEAKRKYPVLLNPTASRETLRVKLPANFKVDEIPDKANLAAPFGKYSFSCSQENEWLVCSRALEVQLATVPVSQYNSVREFFERIVAFEQTPVVLERR